MMDGYGGGGTQHSTQDLKPPAPNPTGDARFDASQYAFFGNDVVEEVELGGLEEEEDDLGPTGFEEEGFQFERDEGDALGSLSEIDDLSSTFSKLNKIASGPTSVVNGDWGSRESSSAAEWPQEDWFDRRTFDAEAAHENKKWSSQPYSAGHIVESNSLHRTSSYPDQQQQQYPHQQQNLHHQYSTEPVLIPKSSFTSYPPPVGRSPQASPNGQFIHPNMPHQSGPHQMPISSPNLPSFRNPQVQMNSLPHGSPQLGGNMPLLPHGFPVNNRLQNQRPNHYPSDRPSLSNNIPPQQFPNHNGVMPQQMMPPQHSHQNRMQHQFQPSFGHLSGLQSPHFNPHLPPSPPMMNNFDMVGSPDLRDPRAMSMLGNRQGMRYPHQGSDSGFQRGGGGWPRWKSKYMSADEIENILRMQLAATHSNDPYVDDYYHQACLARNSSGAKLKHHFCPTSMGDGSTRTHASNEPHPFLQVDALGRVSFSSIRRPRPLLEVDAPNSSTSGVESKLSEKPLEQEPMLAARVTIEDGLLLLLDVDDIDRYLQFNHLQDGGSQLRQRRQVLLEGLATSFQLVDPLGRNGHTVDLSPGDDLVFLRLLSLPKGRKLILRYLQLLSPGELPRIVCMAIFRHLRFLFGNYPADTGASITTTKLAIAVSSCIQNMELKSLAACLASVVCSSEHPPLRPIGSLAGDGASLILKTVLERATELLTDPNPTGNCNASNRAFWQATFDPFFSLLTKYCFNKYDSVVQSFLIQGSQDMAAMGADIAKAIKGEIPVELLRASLPHTNEQQRKLLLEFAQRSMPVTGGSGSS